MPHSSQESGNHPDAPGFRSAKGTVRTSQVPRPAAPVPGSRSVPGPRPAPPRADHGRPAPGPPAPAVPRPAVNAGATPRIQLVSATDATAVEAADETVDKLLDEGRPPTDVLVLTTGEHHPWAEHELSFGEDAYWRQQADGGDVFYAHASAVDRTTGRPVVVLAVNGGTDEQAARALPAALARAGSHLVVCGDPRRLRGLL